MPQPIPPRYCPSRELPRERSAPGAPRRGSWHGRELPGELLPPARWRESEAWLFGVDLWNAGFAWEAYEVWEVLWNKARSTSPLQAKFLQGLVMVAASVVHVRRGNMETAHSLRESGPALLMAVRTEAGPVFMGLDLDGFIAGVEENLGGGNGEIIPLLELQDWPINQAG